jgi:hypothetical protein
MPRITLKRLYKAIDIRVSKIITNNYWRRFYRQFFKRVNAFNTSENKSEVCYIVSSGPSLVVEDLEKIGSNYSISSSRIQNI